MPAYRDTILIIHNTFGDPADPLYESRAGVMDQVRAVEAACEALGLCHETLPVSDLRTLTKVLGGRKETLIFNLAEEFLGNVQEASFVPAVCRAFGKSCTGNDTTALLLAQNKVQAKALLAGSGLPVPGGTTVAPGMAFEASSLPAGTYILKPAFCDASEGITAESVVRLPEESTRAEALVASLHRQFAQPVIVEQYIPTRELNVSVIERGGRPKVMPLAEIDFSAFPDGQHKIVDYSAKWDAGSFGFHNTPRKIPAELPAAVSEHVAALAKAAWAALGCRDYARVDFRLDEQLNPYILEINPNPDISPDAGFAAALTAGGIAYERFVWTVLDNARQRIETVELKMKN